MLNARVFLQGLMEEVIVAGMSDYRLNPRNPIFVTDRYSPGSRLQAPGPMPQAPGSRLQAPGSRALGL